MLENPLVISNTLDISSILQHDYWGMHLLHPQSHKSFRPLSTITFWLIHHVWGKEAAAFHAANMLVHGLNSALVALVARYIFCIIPRLISARNDPTLRARGSESKETAQLGRIANDDSSESSEEKRTVISLGVNASKEGISGLWGGDPLRHPKLKPQISKPLDVHKSKSHYHLSSTSSFSSTYGVMASLSACLLFATHPMHTEAVSNITNLSELLSLFFQLLSFLSYVHWVMPDAHHYVSRMVALILSLLCIVCATACKETGIMVAGLLLAVEIVHADILPIIAVFLFSIPIRNISHGKSKDAYSRNLRENDKVGAGTSLHAAATAIGNGGMFRLTIVSLFTAVVIVARLWHQVGACGAMLACIIMSS